MDNFLRFIASPAGRVTRVAAGTSLIAAGLAQGRKGWPLAIAGLLPLSMGAFDWCLLAPLMGLPFDGPQLRAVIGPGPATADSNTAQGGLG
ncbi:YgaP-like transmembrane domain [Hymenobacter properus]|uniref:DUF2892 domain-containing protein n=1 Tax=Hymenobacter properus TaxID=2791026 RepID=A0A931FMW4_9BACT|nr:YgaP-like transmembrane domain [Hymenobacter properus]MBF9144450.1 DUF2892 domain-containing protein [Hymenobacter properus]MBR7723268.1 DUF2892 domain-containing protein [Microvirga sp. SRT04]